MPAVMTTFEATPETIQGFIRLFKCERCNKCEESIGRVFLNMGDIHSLAKNLNMTRRNFLETYAYAEDGSWYLPAPCPFYDGEGCMVQDYKPNVCLQFPFNQTVKCKNNAGREMDMITINTGCPAGKKLAEKFGVKV